MIDYQYSLTNPNEAKLMNLYQSKTAGVTLATITKYKSWNISLGGSYTGFYNDLSADDKTLPELQWSAEINSQLGYNFSKAGLSMNLFYKFTGERPYYVTDNSTQQIIPTTLEGYHMTDLTAVKKLGKYFAISAGVRNLFDVDRITSSHTNSSGGGVHSDSGTRNIASGRSFFAGLQFNWEKN